MNDDLDFEIGNDNTIESGCGAILMGQMMYFGGVTNKKQVCFPIVYFWHHEMLRESYGVGLFLILERFSNFLKVLKLEGCEMKRQADLTFNVDAPACNSFGGSIPKILICFSYYTTKVCHT